MAEPAAGFDIRRILLVGGVLVVVIFSVFFFFLRGCAPTISARKSNYTVIYSNLDLKDAANVIARLKELAIPYEIRDEGRAVAVPKEKADQARLGLAEKNLPMGGVVGWEIFDQSKLGATDFDRRIQLIRAISGELSRTIRRIEGVEDARVQIVIPETKLFAATVAPVTASVLLRLRPGVELTPEKINGIIHLVASSVENLQPENVTVVDDTGRILSALALYKGAPGQAPTLQAEAPAPVPPPAEKAVEVKTKEVAVSAEVVLEKVPTREKAPTSPEVVVVSPEVTKVATLTAEERILLRAQAKKELEQDLSGKAQELLNRYYPINSVIVKVGVALKPTKTEEIKAKDLKIKKLYAVVLVDNRLDLTSKLKQATFTTVAAAIGYDRKRGDRIIIQKVPFHLATPLPTAEAVVKKPKLPLAIFIPRFLLKFTFWVAAIIVLFVMAILLLKKLQAKPPVLAPEEERFPRKAEPIAREKVSMLDQIKSMAERNPERIAELLKSWLSE